MSLVDLGKRLLEASKHGETDEVRLLMTNGAPFTTDWLGTSPLHMAAQYGHVATAEVLLRGGISRDARTKVDKTPLHIAAQEGHLAIVELLLSHGAEVDAKDMLKMTPLHWSVERGHLLVAKMLLRSNADVHACSKFDKTPLEIAKDNMFEDFIDLLSNHVANPDGVKQASTNVKIVHVNQPTSSSPKLINIPVLLKSPDGTITLNAINNKKQSSNAQSTVTSAPVPSAASIKGAQAKNLKSPFSNCPIVFPSNQLSSEYIASLKRIGMSSSPMPQTFCSSDSEEGEISDPGCTNVLTTLAALAEATAPNASMSSSEAMKWLEMHGITMLPADNSTIVASAVEGGQTVSLTEAGKLALRFVKKHPSFYNNSLNTSPVSESNQNATVTSTTSTSQRVITIVADQSRIPSIISSPQTPIVVLNNQHTDSNSSTKKLKTIQLKKSEKNAQIINGNVNTLDDESSKLKKELEEMKRTTELYKAQLLQKEYEAEQYKKQLEQMKNLSQVEQ